MTIGFFSLIGAVAVFCAACSAITAPQEASITTLQVNKPKPGNPKDSLLPVFPNPFNRALGDTSFTIQFDLDTNAKSIYLLVQNALGDEVVGYHDSTLTAGFYACQWRPQASDGTRLNAGLYFITLRTSNFIYSRLVNLEENE